MQVKSDQNLKQLCGTPSGLNQAKKRSSTVASAVPLDFHALQPDVMSTEMAEDVMEASFARGLAAAECFEVSPKELHISHVSLRISQHEPCHGTARGESKVAAHTHHMYMNVQGSYLLAWPSNGR